MADPNGRAFGVAPNEVGESGRRDGRVLRVRPDAMAHERISRCASASDFNCSAAQALIARTLHMTSGTRSCRDEQAEDTKSSRKMVPELLAHSFFALVLNFMKRCSSAPRDDPDPPLRSRARTVIHPRIFAFTSPYQLASRMLLPACPRSRDARA